MEPDWILADFKNAGKLDGAAAETLRLANETLARDLGISLSAFLRASVAATYTHGAKEPVSDFLKEDERSCFGAVLTKDQHKLLLRADHSVLFPLIGIALGAKPGAFASPARKPTEIELQVVLLLFRLILSDTYRAWSQLVTTQLETLTLEIEPTPARVLPPTELMCVAQFDLAIGEHTGQVSIAAPAALFLNALDQQTEREPRIEPSASLETTLELMMPAKIAVDIWLDSSDIRLGDLLQLREGQIVKLDHTVDQRVACTLNGKRGFQGQIVSTGARRAFLIEDFTG